MSRAVIHGGKKKRIAKCEETNDRHIEMLCPANIGIGKCASAQLFYSIYFCSGETWSTTIEFNQSIFNFPDFFHCCYYCLCYAVWFFDYYHSMRFCHDNKTYCCSSWFRITFFSFFEDDVFVFSFLVFLAVDIIAQYIIGFLLAVCSYNLPFLYGYCCSNEHMIFDVKEGTIMQL